MSKKGFVLMETIIVIVVVSVALLTLFSSYNKILSKVKSENRYDNPEHVYMTYYIKNKLLSPNIFDLSEIKSGTNTLIDYSSEFSANEKENFGIKKVYIITGVGSSGMSNNLVYFDAYMIDYIKNLDVSTNDNIILVEYKKIDKDESLSDKQIYFADSSSEDLSKTYIASLKW